MVKDFLIGKAIKIIRDAYEKSDIVIDCLFDIKNKEGKSIFSNKENARKFMEKTWKKCHENRNNQFY